VRDLITLFCVALATALLPPQTSVGKLLRRLLIEWPARALSKLTPARIVFALLVPTATIGLITFAKIDGLTVGAQAIPEGLTWFAAFDVATYIDVIGLVLLVAATVRFRAAHRAACSAAARVRQWVSRCVGALRERSQSGARSRSHRIRRQDPPPTGEDGGWPAPAFSVA
jgi:hypothetical protein